MFEDMKNASELSEKANFTYYLNFSTDWFVIIKIIWEVGVTCTEICWSWNRIIKAYWILCSMEPFHFDASWFMDQAEVERATSGIESTAKRYVSVQKNVKQRSHNIHIIIWWLFPNFRPKVSVLIAI